jgi:hypothetical protein
MMCAVHCVRCWRRQRFSCGQAGTAAAAPSGPIAPSDSLNGLMSLLQGEVVSAAEAMPADKYDFAPATTMGEFKGVRNFGSQVKHLAEANYEFFQGWTVPGATAVDPKTIEALKTKDDIVKALKDSYTPTRMRPSRRSRRITLFWRSPDFRRRRPPGFRWLRSALRTRWITTGRWSSTCA